MILDYQVISLWERPLFSKAVVDAPIRLGGTMPQREACFAYVLEGKSLIYASDAVFTLEEREAFLARCGSYLNVLLDGQATGRYRALTVHFHADVLNRLYADALPRFLNEGMGRRRSMAKVRSSALVRHFMEGLPLLFDLPEPADQSLLALKLKEIIFLLWHTKNGPYIREMMSGMFDRPSVEFKAVIETHICSPITIAELASLTNQSLSAFKRNFQKIYGDSPRRYLLDRRLEEVARLLTVSNRRISSIAYDCGFRSPAHLSRVFKARYGVSPSEFAKKGGVGSLDKIMSHSGNSGDRI